MKTKPSYPYPQDKYEPTNPHLWTSCLEVASGERLELKVGDRTIHAPNDGRGYRNMPHNPKGIAWAVKQYSGFGGNWRDQKEAMVRMAHGAIHCTEGAEEVVPFAELEREGLVRRTGAKGSRVYWDLTKVGFMAVEAGLKQELLDKVKDLKERGSKYQGSDTLSADDKAAIGDFAKWFRSNFHVDSARRTPTEQKRLKQEAAALLRTMETLSLGGTTYAHALKNLDEGPWGRSIADNLDELVKHFTSEGATDQKKTVPLVEVEGRYGKYFNRANISNETFHKYVSRFEIVLGTLKGWRRRALTSGVKVVFVGGQQLKTYGQYKTLSDELWVKATPQVLKRGGGYGSPEYIMIHELGHRFEHKNPLPIDFEMDGWETTKYSRTDGERFAELFALGHFELTGSWASVVERFEKEMA